MGMMLSEVQRQLTMPRLTRNSDVLQKVLFLITLFAVSCGWSQQPNPNAQVAQADQRFDGKWWSKSSSEEQSGFINGAADCMTWSARKKGFNATPEQLVKKITAFYKKRPQSANLPVIEVWQKVVASDVSRKSSIAQGQTWTNAHWYLDGFWWRGAAEDERLGFLEGYLWCMRTYVPKSSQKYSKPVQFYLEKVDAFVRANGSSKANREPVALILRRYQDENISDSKR